MLSTVVASGRRLWILFATILTFSQTSIVGVGILKWCNSWWMHRQQILVLTAVNVGITTASEVISRTIIAPLTDDHRSFGFLIKEPNTENISINRQSLINIWTTFFASLLGGPVYFIRKRWQRFLFFVGFGTFNSFLSQWMSALIRDGILTIAFSRLMFDFFYNGTLKFLMFEFWRTPILNANLSFLRIGFLRGKQDFATTFFKVSLLNLFGFKG